MVQLAMWIHRPVLPPAAVLHGACNGGLAPPRQAQAQIYVTECTWSCSLELMVHCIVLLQGMHIQSMSVHVP